MTTGKCKHGEFDLAKGCRWCIAERQAQGKVELKIKVTAPDDAPAGEEEKAAGEIIKLAETIAEIQGDPEPEAVRGKPDYFDQPSNYTFNEVAKLVEVGRMAGMREVVNWVDEELEWSTPWQEQKKAWGIESQGKVKEELDNASNSTVKHVSINR